MTNQAPAPAANPLPAPQDAFATLQNKVANDVFFQKLAQYGIVPQNEKEAAELIELAGKLQVAEQEQGTKTAGDQTSRYSDANAVLGNLLESRGLGNQVKSAHDQEQDMAYANYARQLAGDSGLYNAVLSVKQAQADQVAQQIGYNPEAAAATA